MITIKSQLTISHLHLDVNLIKIPSILSLIKKQNVGDIVNYGRYKGTKADESYIIIAGGLDEILDFCIKTLESEIIDPSEMILDIQVEYIGQCNFELSISQLKKIALLSLPLSISCYQSDT